jgi:hypothetical protein
VPGHSVSRLDYCIGSTAPMPCIRTRRLRRSASRQSVALAISVRPVTLSRGSTTHRSVAPTLLRLCRASEHVIFATRLLVSRSHWLSLCARSLRLAARLLVAQLHSSTVPISCTRTRRFATRLLTDSTSTTPCAMSTRLSVASALHQPRRALRLNQFRLQ